MQPGFAEGLGGLLTSEQSTRAARSSSPRFQDASIDLLWLNVQTELAASIITSRKKARLRRKPRDWDRNATG